MTFEGLAQESKHSALKSHHRPPALFNILNNLQMPTKCRTFCLQYVEAFVQDTGLHSCFKAHLVTLWECSLIDSETVDDCMKIIAKHSASLKG